MTIEQYKAKLLEWRKAREAGTPAPIVIGTKMTEADWDFCILAVNNWTELIDAHSKAIETLEYYSIMRHPVYQDKAKQTLSQITGEK